MLETGRGRIDPAELAILIKVNILLEAELSSMILSQKDETF